MEVEIVEARSSRPFCAESRLQDPHIFAPSILVGVSGVLPLVTLSVSGFADKVLSVLSRSTADFRPSPMTEGEEDAGVDVVADEG